MDEDDRELVRRLMARATVVLEAAVAGQSPQAAPDQRLEGAPRLHAAALDIAAVAQAAVIITTAGLEEPPDGRDHIC